MLNHGQQLQFFMHYVQSHPHASGIIAFLIAFCESLAVVGTIIPGSVTMTGIGILIGAHIFHPIPAFAWIISGGLLGDYFSYWVGVHYRDRLKTCWPFKQHPQWLIAGEHFFHRHGGKSIIIGRFFGPMRSMVPLVAGMLSMPRTRFILAMIPSITLWAIVYTLPGILLGALSLQLPPKLALTFLAFALLISAAIWGLVWLIQHTLKQATLLINRYAKKSWKYCIKHRRMTWLTTLLCPTHQVGYFHQFTRLILCMLMLICTGLFTWQIITQGLLTHFNAPLNYFLRSIRGTFGSHLMLSFTILADKHVLLTAAGIIGLWLWHKKYTRAAIHWLLLNASTAFCIKLLKILIDSPRPASHLAHAIGTNSFPSGHVTLFASFTTFLALLIMQDIHFKKRYIINYIVMGAIFIIALSRLYLGAHWLTDVVGGLCLGLTTMLLWTLSYKRKKSPRIEAIPLIGVALSVLLISATLYGTTHFRWLDGRYQLRWPTITTTYQQWWHHPPQENQLPHYRLGRLGKPVQPFNLQFSGQLTPLKNHLINQGWQDHPHRSKIPTVLTRLHTHNQNPSLPLLPIRYHNTPPALLLSKTLNNKQLILRLWQANVTGLNSPHPLWLGTLNIAPNHVTHHSLLHHHNAEPQSMNTTGQLLPDLKGFGWKILPLPIDKQAEAIKSLQWDRKVLLIRQISGS